MEFNSECDTAELRSLFLFESLTDGQLDRLCRNGATVHAESGALFTEGDPATCFYVLLDGEIALAKRSGGLDIETIRTTQRGAYFGAWSAFLAEPQVYETSARATRPARMFTIEAEVLGEFLRTEFPMACHFLTGATLGRFNQNRIVGPHDRLRQLAQLTAGLTHELNNPAAAARRATSELRARVAGLRRKLALLADGSMSLDSMRALVDISDTATAPPTQPRVLTPMQKSDLEEALGDWLDDRAVGDAWDLAPVFAEAGLDTDWLDGVAAAMANTGGLLTDTLAMLSHNIGPDITVVTAFDESVPPLPCYPAELNQVWTNLIDNAVTAMRSAGDGGGTLTVRVCVQGECARVEVCDDGPGVPDDLRARVFDPFFTTKPVGEGTGLGLDFAARTVDKHGGSLWVESTPGDTRFICLLPLHAPS